MQGNGVNRSFRQASQRFFLVEEGADGTDRDAVLLAQRDDLRDLVVEGGQRKGYDDLVDREISEQRGQSIQSTKQRPRSGFGVLNVPPLFIDEALEVVTPLRVQSNLLREGSGLPIGSDNQNVSEVASPRAKGAHAESSSHASQHEDCKAQ